MYKREEASQIREEFWTVFGKYMSPVVSAEGLNINWVNYHTRLKDVYFRMDTGKHSAMISISMEHRDTGIQELYFEQFQEFKMLLQDTLQEEWEWQLRWPIANEKIVSRIYKEISGVSILNKNDWPELISFFKPRIILLDTFWESARYSFERLR